jgi:hypothetical protein
LLNDTDVPDADDDDDDADIPLSAEAEELDVRNAENDPVNMLATAAAMAESVMPPLPLACRAVRVWIRGSAGAGSARARGSRRAVRKWCIVGKCDVRVARWF